VFREYTGREYSIASAKRCAGGGRYKGRDRAMTISIELDRPSIEDLSREAVELGLPLEELAGRILHGHIRNRRNDSAVASDEAFRVAMEGTLQDYDEAYRRLAK